MAPKPAFQTAVLNLAANAYVQADPNLSISFLGSNPYTFEGWVFLNGLCAQSLFVSKPDEFSFGSIGAKLFVQRTNQPSPLVTPNVLQTNKWYHVAVTYSQSGTLTLYLNGIQQGQMITHDPGINNQGQAFQMGPELQGKMREMRFWNIWRSESEIFQNQFQLSSTSPNLLADFDFSQYPIVDLSGNNHTVQYMGDFIAIAYSDIASPAMALLGTGFAEPVHETEINPGNEAFPYSVQAWIYLTTDDGVQCIFANGNWSDNTGIALYVDNGILKSQRGSPQDIVLSGTTILQPLTWYNVATVYDGTTLYLYLDVGLEGQMAAPVLPNRSEGSPIIGASHDSTEPNPNYFFQGYIQTVTVWNVALTATDIQQWMYQDPFNQSGLIAYYNFTNNPAENLCTTNSMGLVDGAFIDVVHTQVSTTNGVEPRMALPAMSSASRKFPYDSAARAVPFSDAHYQSIVDEYTALLDDLFTSEQRLAYQTKFSTDLKKVFAEIASNRDKPPAGTVTYQRDANDWVFLEHRPEGTQKIYRVSVEELDECTIWLITYVWTVIDAFLSVLGIPTASDRGITYVTQLMNDPGLKAFFVRSVQGAITGITAILVILQGLYMFGYLVAVLKWVAETLTWWVLTIVIGKAVSYFVPGLGEAALVAYISNAAVAIYQVEHVYLQKPSNCYNTTFQ